MLIGGLISSKLWSYKIFVLILRSAYLSTVGISTEFYTPGLLRLIGEHWTWEGLEVNLFVYGLRIELQHEILFFGTTLPISSTKADGNGVIILGPNPNCAKQRQ